MSEADPFREPARLLVDQMQAENEATAFAIAARAMRIAAEEAYDYSYESSELMDAGHGPEPKEIQMEVASRILERIQKEKANG